MKNITRLLFGLHAVFMVLLMLKLYLATTFFHSGAVNDGLAEVAFIVALTVGYCASLLFHIFLEVRNKNL